MNITILKLYQLNVQIDLAFFGMNNHFFNQNQTSLLNINVQFITIHYHQQILLIKKMSSQYNNYQQKQYFEQKPNQNTTRKSKPRQSEPPMRPDYENSLENTREYKVRTPRPSDIPYQSKQMITKGSNSSQNLNSLIGNNNSKRTFNQTKQESSKIQEDNTYTKNIELTSERPKIKDYLEQNTTNINRVLSPNRLLSPEIKNKSQNHMTERKYSQNFEDMNFFKGYSKPSAPNLKSKPTLNKNYESKQSNQQQVEQTQVRRAPRFSEPVNTNYDIESQDTSTIYTQNNIGSRIEEKKSRNNQIFSSNQKQKNPTIIPSTFNPQKIKQNASQFNNLGNVFRKQKELKETVSTHSTFNSNRNDGSLLNNLYTRKPSKNQKIERYELKTSDFVKGKILGSGKFGEVCVVRHKLTGFICAMKSIPKAMIRQQNIINQLIRQLKIQSFLDHPNIVKLYSFFHDKDYIYLLQELGSSGQLYKVIKQKQRLTEPSVSYIIKQVCQAINYMHFFKIIHRDLKPENIVIQSGTIKICDLGWAVCRGNELRSTFCGTPLYVSPQLLKGQLYDEGVDLWAIGILTYELLVGNIPFQISTEQQLIKIIKEDIVFPKNIPISNEAKNFILNILKKNPEDRLKIGELLEHSFLKKNTDGAIQLE